MKEQLEAAGYQVDLQYAEDDIPTQVSQVENMVTKGVQMLVIAAIDGTALGDILNTAEESDIPVLAYDRLIRESGAVDYYSTFDNFGVGVLQAEALVEGLKATGEGPYNVELFAGSPDDNNATFFWNGAMSILQPLIDSGEMVVVSGQTDFEQAAILRWDPATAQKRMEDLLTKSYTTETVDGVLSPYDGLSLGIIAALKANGYGSGDKPLSVVTGQDAEIQSVQSILKDEQNSTVFKDTRELAEGHGRHDRGDRQLRGARGQRHHDVRQRRQGRPELPAQAGHRDQGQRHRGPGRHRLLHAGRDRRLILTPLPSGSSETVGGGRRATVAATTHHHPNHLAAATAASHDTEPHGGCEQ